MFSGMNSDAIIIYVQCADLMKNDILRLHFI